MASPTSFESLAGLLGDLQSEEQGVRLLAAASTARAKAGCARFPIRTPPYDSALNGLREALDVDAFDTAWAAGAALSLDEAVEYAERGRGSRKRPLRGWDSLSPAELRVVELVTEGLTNPQIGERLFVSRRSPGAGAVRHSGPRQWPHDDHDLLGEMPSWGQISGHKMAGSHARRWLFAAPAPRRS